MSEQIGESGGATAENFDETDVPNALERHTDDGQGEDEPGEGDFESYATDGVEWRDSQ